MTTPGLLPRQEEEPVALWAAGHLGKKQGAVPEVVFAQVREDAAVEVAALASREPREVAFCIGSGGCTAFSLLTGDLRKLYVVDVNPAQVYLLELKQAAFARLSYDAMLESMTADARSSYPLLRPHLTPAARAFWEERQHLLARGLNQCGIIERKLMRGIRLFLPLVLGRRRFETFFEQTDLEAQRRFYRQEWDNWRWRSALRWALSRPVLRFVYGGSFVDRIPDGFSRLVRQRVDAVLTSFPIQENGYVWQTFRGSDPPREHGLPISMRREQFEKIRSGLAQLEVTSADAARWLEARPSASIGFFALSNILEVTTPDYTVRLLEAVCHAAKPGALVCLRSLFPPAPDELGQFGEKLALDAALSARLESMDRSLFCKFIRVLRVKP